jgi:hypothetical protein
MSSQEPDLKQISTLLKEGFSVNELLEFCFGSTRYKPIHDNWSASGTRDELVRLILDFGHRKLILDELIDYAKQHNPNRYEMYQPYYKDASHLASYGLLTTSGSAAIQSPYSVSLLRYNDIGHGVILGGNYQGFPLEVVASKWSE